MNFQLETAEIFVPDGSPVEGALARTTHLCIAAHQDDIEIMAVQPILECFQQDDKWFSGVVVTDGRGSPRDGMYARYTDEDMRLVRFKEQFKAAFVGEYAAQIILDYPSIAVKDRNNSAPIEDIAKILKITRPQIVFTHNLADKHPTHVGVAIKVVKAIRSLPTNEQPAHLYGSEVWRGLDWLMDDEKVVLDCSPRNNLQSALLGVFDSQISGGKRYDLATMGRRLTNATFFASHATDNASGIAYAMDLTPLISNPNLDVQDFVQAHIDRFAQDVNNLIASVY
jgi:LmbE family N-acetylglucosaminyl deacetylase